MENSTNNSNNLICSIDNDEKRVMHSKSKNVEMKKQMKKNYYKRTFWFT